MQVTHFFQVGGTLSEDAPSYIKRPADSELLEALQQRELCLVLAPRQTGKSSLMVRAMGQLRKYGVHTGYIDLQNLAGQQDPERWFGAVINQIRRSLKLSTDSARWWQTHDQLDVAERFANFFEDVVLSELNGEIVLFIDEVELALSKPFSDNFFTTIRYIYNARAVKPILRNLTFVLLGVATASSFIRNPSRTPFNVGKSIILDDFDQKATESFQTILGPDSRELVERIFYWTNGQPFLVQKLAETAYSWSQAERTPEHMDQEVNRFYLQSVIEQDTHLKPIQDRLLSEMDITQEVLKMYQSVLKGKSVIEDKLSRVQDQLKLAGVVRIENKKLYSRNRIYETVFNKNWVKTHLPRRIREVIVYVVGCISFISASVLLWIFFIQPLFFPFLYLPNTHKIVKYTDESSIKITFPATKTHRAFLDDQEIIVPQNGIIRQFVRELTIGNQNKHELVFVGRFPHQDYKVSIEIHYYPNWTIHQLPLLPEDFYGLVSVSFDGQKVIVGSLTHSFTLRDVITGEILQRFNGHQSSVIGVDFSPNSQFVISGSLDKTLKLWDIKTGDVLQTFRGHNAAVLQVDFSPTDPIVVSGSLDHTLKLWDISTGQLLKTFRGHHGAVNSVAFAPDGQTVVSGSQDNTLKLWDISTGQLLKTFRGHYGAINSIAFAPDGQSVISASNDMTLVLWSIKTGKQLQILVGHNSAVIDVAFSPDGKRAVSTSGDNIGKLWNVEIGSEVRNFIGHNSIYGVDFSPDGQTVISSDASGVLTQWWAMIEQQY